MEQAVPTSTLSSFIAQLLAPIIPPADEKAARRFAAEKRHELERAWDLVKHRLYAAQSYRDHCAHVSRAAEIEQRRLVVPEAVAAEQAQLDMITAIDVLMLVPAPTTSLASSLIG